MIWSRLLRLFVLIALGLQVCGLGHSRSDVPPAGFPPGLGHNLDRLLHQDETFSFILGGKPSKQLLRQWTKTVRREKVDRRRSKQVVTYSDPATGLELRSEAVAYTDYPAIEWTLYFKNKGTNDSPILEDIRTLDDLLSLGATSSTLNLHYSRGGIWAPNAFEPLSKPLGLGARLQFSPTRTERQSQWDNPGGGLSSNPFLPFFNLEERGGGMILGIGWSGQWAVQFQRETEQGIRLRAGMEKTHLRLHPGEEIRTPLVLLLAWRGRWIDGQNQWRRFVLDHYTPQKGGRPVQAPISFSAWGSEPAAQHLAKIRKLAELKSPIDYYWIDAEWFGTPKQGSWTDNVGNWYVNRAIYPEGMEAVSQAVHRAGLGFILWFEPGRVIEGTALFREHKDWLLGPGVGFFEKHWLFDYGNPAARAWMTDHLSKMIADFKIDIFRSDFAFEDTLLYLRQGEAADRQGMREIRFVEGFYRLWDELLRRHPGLLIDNCSGGARMIDLETMRRSIPLWSSDLHATLTNPTFDQGHSFGSFYWLPISGQNAPQLDAYAYQFHSNMRACVLAGWAGGEIPANFSTRLFNELLSQARKTRPYYYGDYYPLTDYSLSDSAWLAYQMHRPDLQEGMVMAFRRPGCAQAANRFKLQGLDKRRIYRINCSETSTTMNISGGELMTSGLAISIPQRPGSALVFYAKK